MSTLSVLIFAYIFFRKFCKFGRFCKIKYMQNFLLKSICVNICTQFIFPENEYTKKNMHKKWSLIQHFLESINNNSFSIMTCLSFRWFNGLFLFFFSVLKLKKQVGLEIAFKINQIAIFMLFQLCIFILLYSIRKLHISWYVSSIFLIFALNERFIQN